MKVHLIKKQSIEDYVMKNAQIRPGFKTWLSLIKVADWNAPSGIIETFNSADIIGKSSNRVVFNISGNNYRMICSYHFGRRMVHLFVCWIGTHTEYDKLCSKNRQYDISNY